MNQGSRQRLVLGRPGGGRVEIAPSALASLSRYVQRSPRAPESGGVLLGRHIRDSRDMVIDDVTTPMPGDRRSRFRFLRHHARHQGVLDRAWATSGGTCTLIGEWAYAPGAGPRAVAHRSVDLAAEAHGRRVLRTPGLSHRGHQEYPRLGRSAPWHSAAAAARN